MKNKIKKPCKLKCFILNLFKKPSPEEKAENLRLKNLRIEYRPIIKAERHEDFDKKLKLYKNRICLNIEAYKKFKEEKKQILVDKKPTKKQIKDLKVAKKIIKDQKAFLKDKNSKYSTSAVILEAQIPFDTFKNCLKENKKRLFNAFKKNKEDYQTNAYNIYKNRKLRESDYLAEGKMRKFYLKEKYHAYIFLAPWLFGFIVLTLYPIIQTLIYSFSDVTITIDGIKTSYVGFNNYIYAFITDGDFITALQNYVVQMILYVPIITVISLIIALLLNSKVKGSGFFRTIFFLPVIITSGPVIKIFIDQGVASFPGIEKMIDFEQLKTALPSFLVSALSFLTSEFVMILWFCGIQILVFMTGLQKIDKGVYEASAIDGANKWERFWKVTLPAINPVIVINVVFTVVMQSIFSLNPIIVKIQEDMKSTGEGKGYGYASAMSWIYFIVMILLLLIFVFIFKKHNRKVRNGGDI